MLMRARFVSVYDVLGMLIVIALTYSPIPLELFAAIFEAVVTNSNSQQTQNSK